MKIEKVHEYKEPEFPAKETVLNDRSLIEIIPARWLGKSLLVLTAGVFIGLSLTGCNMRYDGVPAPPATPIGTPLPATYTPEPTSGSLFDNKIDFHTANLGKTISNPEVLATRYLTQSDITMKHMDMGARINDFLNWLKAENLI